MTNLPNDDAELLEMARRELYTAVVGDISDTLGYRRQFLFPEIHQVSGEGSPGILVGRAMPVLEADVFQEPSGPSPFGLMLKALDDLKPGEVYLCTGGSRQYALVGELMCTAMAARGAVGAVCDGYARDLAAIRATGYPVFARGSYSQDQRGRGAVLDFRVSVEINGVRIEPGDYVIADADGVMVVPKEPAVEILTRALEKARSEKKVKKAIENGMLVSEAFARFGIL